MQGNGFVGTANDRAGMTTVADASRSFLGFWVISKPDLLCIASCPKLQTSPRLVTVDTGELVSAVGNFDELFNASRRNTARRFSGG